MKRSTIPILLALGAVGTVSADAWATSWCSANHPGAIFCDDFDTYCVRDDGLGYPGDPDCPSGAAKNNALMQEVWPNGGCGSGFNIKEDDQIAIGNDPGFAWQSPPFGVGYMFTSQPPKPTGGLLGQQSFRDWADPAHPDNLSRLIGNAFGTQYAAVAGTDGAPLIMEFFMNGMGSGKLYYGNGYWEVAMSDDRANTDYVYSPDCATYCNPPINQGPFPIICAQGNPDGLLPTGCPSASTAPIHKSIAVGVLTLVDTDPCHCGSVLAHSPQGSHLMVYDGQKWWTLKQNMIPGATSGWVVGKKAWSPDPPPYDDVVPGSGVPRPGHFVLGMGMHYTQNRAHNWVKLTIRATTFDVEHTALIRANPTPDYEAYGFPPYDEGDYQWWITSVITGIPRAYKEDPANGLTGAFDTIRMGVARGCPLASNADWSACDPSEPNRTCISANAESSLGTIVTNDFVLHGGAGYSLYGACCKPDASCEENTTQAHCEGPLPDDLGGRWQGTSSTCSTVSCCPIPFADADHDGDVDQDDFGAFQVCFTGYDGGVPPGCSCFERNSDSAITVADFQAFGHCWTGPNVPWNQSLTPTCVP